MPGTLISAALAILLVSGLYSSMMWLDVWGMRSRRFWKRVAVASGIGHVVLLAVFLLVAYLDFRATENLLPEGVSFSAFLFNDPDFWRVFLIFDTLAAIAVVGVLGALDALGWQAGAILGISVCLALLVGTAQWWAIGGLLGKGIDHLIGGLRTPDDEMPDWF